MITITLYHLGHAGIFRNKSYYVLFNLHMDFTMNLEFCQESFENLILFIESRYLFLLKFTL